MPDIIIRGPDLLKLAYIDNYFAPSIQERINSEYTFSFQTIIDEEKSQYVVDGNIAEIDGQYFNIIHHRRTRSGDGSLIVAAECEQVAYDLLDEPLPEFVQAGTPSDVLALLLSGTSFTIGIAEPTGVISVVVNEETNKRAILMQIAAAAGGELLFDKYSISLLQRRGMNQSVQFRFGKNLAGITKDADIRSGVRVVAYEIDIIELRSLPNYEDAGLEIFELGDTVRVIDPDIGVDGELRIVEYEYNPQERINSSVTIANFVQGIQDTIVTMQKTTVVKDKLYYNTQFGPDIGFRATRSDNKGRATMNGDGISIQKGDGGGSAWEDVIYLDTDGDARFTGIITASAFVGGTIAIGEGDNIFKAGADGIHLGDDVFADAPFSVSMAGFLKAQAADITGKITSGEGSIGGWILGSNSLKDASGVVGISSAVTGGDDIRFFAGHATPSSAPFRVTESGLMTATNGVFTGTITATGGTIGGFTINSTMLSGAGIIQGGTIRTAGPTTYPRVEMDSTGNIFQAFLDANNYIAIDPDRTGSPTYVFETPDSKALMYPDDFSGQFTLLVTKGDMAVNTQAGRLQLAASGNIELLPSGQVVITSWSKLYNGSQSLQTALNAKANTFSGISSTYRMVTNVDFSSETYYYYDLHFTNGLLTSVT